MEFPCLSYTNDVIELEFDSGLILSWRFSYYETLMEGIKGYIDSCKVGNPQFFAHLTDVGYDIEPETKDLSLHWVIGDLNKTRASFSLWGNCEDWELFWNWLDVQFRKQLSFNYYKYHQRMDDLKITINERKFKEVEARVKLLLNR